MKDDSVRPIPILGNVSYNVQQPVPQAGKQTPSSINDSEAVVSKLLPEINDAGEALKLARDLGRRLEEQTVKSIDAQKFDLARIEKLLSDD